jgi:hypothetical protein
LTVKPQMMIPAPTIFVVVIASPKKSRERWLEK